MVLRLEQKRLFISDSRRFQIAHKHEDNEETTEPRADVESSCGSDGLSTLHRFYLFDEILMMMFLESLCMY
jgi:hypothetical protein